MSLYRDPLAGLRSQIATKRGLLESRERALSALLRMLLPRALQGRLNDLRELALADADSLEALTRSDAALDELLAAHERAAGLLPALRTCPDECPDPPRPAIGPPWVFEEPRQLGFRAVLTRRLGEISPDAWLIRWDDTTYLSRLELAGAPLVLTSRYDAIGRPLPRFESTVRTSVPSSCPTLRVRREGLLDGIGRAIGVVRDARVGSEVFDEMFVVDAEDTAAGLLTSEVTRALLSMASLVPRLDVNRGVAKVSWAFDYGARGDELMPDAALAVALGLRDVFERG